MKPESKTWILAVLVAIVLSLLGCDQSPEPDSSLSSAESDQPKIVAFGDSLTAGLGVSPEESYPAQLQRRLEAAGYPHRVINAGVNGETTAGALRRVPLVLKSNPSLVILETGGNDGLRGVDPKETRQNLNEIISRLKAAGVTVVLTGMKLPPNYGAEYTAEFARIFPDLAQAHHLPFMPFFLEGVATRAPLNQADGIHPTGEGYRIVVDHLMPILEPLLKRTPVRASSVTVR